MSEPLARSVLDSGEIVEEHPYVDPIDLFAEFASQPHSLLLHASNTAVAASGAEESRYSFIAVEPYKTVTAKNGATEISGEAVDGDAFDVLANCLKLEGYKANQDRRAGQDVPPFRGGAAGVFGYDLARSLERLPPQQPPYALDTLYVPDMSIGLYDTVVAIDHRERRTFVIASTHREAPKSLPEPDPETGLQRWRARIGAVRALPDPYLPGGHASVRALTPRPDYEAAVARIVEYILDGDIFQANLSQRFDVSLDVSDDAFSVFRRLCRLNPAPFASFCNLGSAQVVSSSPELFLRVRDGEVETRPIKGTRPRGRTPAEDADLAQELSESAKDRAENVMIVDLLRNDLLKVCSPGSVRVPALCRLESYASVHHLVSSVTGTLEPTATCVDLLAACFPGGSITGAPKVRAMEIIAELEPTTRGPYCGSIGYIGFDGTMDTNIAIRTLTVSGGTATVQAGGGIVADSDPVTEYLETLDKAGPLLEAAGSRRPETAAASTDLASESPGMVDA